MEQFYIDRQFGQPIYIDVENGIVLRCYNESEKYNARMNELYVGNTINFLKEDFIGRAMKGVYHNLRPMAVTDAIRKIEAVKTRIIALWKIHASNETTDAERAEIKGRVKELELQQYEYEKELTTVKQRIINEHSFIS